MLEAVRLSKTFHPHRSGPVKAVQDASFAVQKGEVFGLLGPNGAGKTTLLRMLGTIITPTEGYSVIMGNRSDEKPLEARRCIGFLSGNTKLYGRLTGAEVLSYFGKLYGMKPRYVAQRVDELVELLGMAPFIKRRCDTLSTGQLQRVSVARVILHDPPVLILDEPTLGLDIMSSGTILDFIADRRAQGCSIIFSTHYMTEAELLCDRVGLIYSGKILAMDTKTSLYEQTGTSNLRDAFLRFTERNEPVR